MEGYHDQYQVAAPKYVYIKDVRKENNEVDYGKLRGKVLIVGYMRYDLDNRNIYHCLQNEDDIRIKINLKDGDFKICVTGKLFDYSRWESKSTETLFPKLFACNVTHLQLQDQNVTYNDYLLLVSSGTLKDLCFVTTQVIDKNKKMVPLEKLCEYLLNIEKLSMYYTADEGTVESIRHKFNTTENTSQALLDLLCLTKLKQFHLCAAPLEKSFNIFSQFMKKHAFANFNITLLCLSHESRVTKAEKSELEKIKKDLIKTWPTNDKPTILF